MGSKAAISIRLPEGRERARPPQDEGRSRLGLWLPHRPGEAGSARRASLHRGCGGDIGPASPSAPRPGRPGGVLPRLPRKPSRARRPQVFALGAGVSVTTELRSRSDVRRPSGRRGREASSRARERRGPRLLDCGGSASSYTWPPSKPTAGKGPHCPRAAPPGRPGTRRALGAAACPFGPRPLPRPASRSTLGPESSAQLSEEAPFPFPYQVPSPSPEITPPGEAVAGSRPPVAGVPAPRESPGQARRPPPLRGDMCLPEVWMSLARLGQAKAQSSVHGNLGLLIRTPHSRT